MIASLRKALKRTPVAWLQVSHNPVKLAIGLAGVMALWLGLMRVGERAAYAAAGVDSAHLVSGGGSA